jgi:hypothetical protein
MSTTYHSSILGGFKALTGAISSTFGYFLNIGPQTYTDNVTAASSTATGNFSANYLAAPTLVATNTAVTTPVASTLTIAGPPVAGTNETITNAYALNILSGLIRFNTSYLNPNNFSGQFNIPLVTTINGVNVVTFAVVSGNITLTNSNTTVSIPVTGRYAISLNFECSNVIEIVLYVNSSSTRLIDRYNGGTVFPDVRLNQSVNAGLNAGDIIGVQISTNAASNLQNYYSRGLTVDLITRTA